LATVESIKKLATNSELDKLVEKVGLLEIALKQFQEKKEEK
jgi:hypothetical protein